MRINCRAKVSRSCYDGRNPRTVYEDGDVTEDGTWDGETVVCDACYMALMPLTPSGQGLLHELPTAITEARRRAGHGPHGPEVSPGEA